MFQHLYSSLHSKVPGEDLLVYFALIIEAYMSDGWLGYDSRFRQNAAASLDTTWARIDPALRNMAFVG